jgi:beta-N-acetylglucosaminidase
MAYDLDSNVLSSSGLTVEQLDNALAGTGLAGLGADFLEVQEEEGINALFAAAHAAVESGWGKSEIAVEKHNLFGINADDSNPDEAYDYSSFGACISYYGSWLRSHYLAAGGEWYHGDTIHDVFIDYSSSHDTEGNTVAEIMNELFAKAGPSTAQETYTVAEGDDLSAIAEHFGMTLAEIEGLNPQAGPNFDLIHPGQQIRIK